jgi:hypothetical protein
MVVLICSLAVTAVRIPTGRISRHRRAAAEASPVTGVKGLPWSIDFGSLRIGSDLKFRNDADRHEAAAKESTYA